MHRTRFCIINSENFQTIYSKTTTEKMAKKMRMSMRKMAMKAMKMSMKKK